MNKKPLGLFEGFGVELEYMIVDRKRFRTLPLADKILIDENGAVTNEISLGDINVSNELASHVLEFKSAGPTDNFVKLERGFRHSIAEINKRLRRFGAILAPGGMHPFMDPTNESNLWTHGNRDIYEAYNRIFDCRGHGWFNLQSCHLNLPFANDAEFGKLHSAIILILPYLSALSASSPYKDGAATEFLDTRLSVYSGNQAKIPQIAGHVVPEAVFQRATYERLILQKSYEAISPYDPNKLLQFEWLNSRGAIARFDRNAIEIRVLDTQECPQRDLAICSLIIDLLEDLCQIDQNQLETLALRFTPEERKEQFMNVARYGRGAAIDLNDIVEALRLPGTPVDVGDLWRHILRHLAKGKRIKRYIDTLNDIIEGGSLSERILSANGPAPSRKALEETVSQLSQSLATNRPYAARIPV